MPVPKTVSLERVHLYSLGIDKPSTYLEVVPPLEPDNVGCNAPIGVLPGRRSANTEIAAAAGNPLVGVESEKDA